MLTFFYNLYLGNILFAISYNNLNKTAALIVSLQFICCKDVSIIFHNTTCSSYSG